MEKVVSITKTDAQQRDVNFWKTQSPEQRLATLEAIRQEYIAWKYGTSQDFKEFITLLNTHKVRYLVIGGYAVEGK